MACNMTGGSSGGPWVSTTTTAVRRGDALARSTRTATPASGTCTARSSTAQTCSTATVTPTRRRASRSRSARDRRLSSWRCTRAPIAEVRCGPGELTRMASFSCGVSRRHSSADRSRCERDRTAGFRRPFRFPAIVDAACPTMRACPSSSAIAVRARARHRNVIVAVVVWVLVIAGSEPDDQRQRPVLRPGRHRAGRPLLLRAEPRRPVRRPHRLEHDRRLPVLAGVRHARLPAQPAAVDACSSRRGRRS